MKLKSLLLLIILAAATLLQAQTDAYTNTNTLLWEISGNGLAKKSYLYGTMHVMCKDELVLRPDVTAAIASSQKIILEADVSNKMAAVKYIMANSTSTDSLSKGLTPDQKEQLRTELAKLNITLDKVEMLKPYIVSTMALAKVMPDCPSTSVEEELLKVAKKSKLKKDYFETIAEQMAIIDQAMTQEYFVASLDGQSDLKSELDSLMTYYKTENLDQISRLMYKNDTNSEAFVRLLLHQRNQNWVAQIPDKIKDESTFIAVGAAHLIGEHGLVQLLRNEGYTVTPKFAN